MTEHVLVCANHANRETTLRCNRCNKPICAQCAIQTPVGYRCKECVRGHQKVFDTARQIDYPIAGVVSAIGLGVGMFLLGFLNWWGLFVAPVVGGGMADVVRWAVRRRRGRYLPLAAVIGGLLGMLPFLWQPLSFLILTLSAGELSGLGWVLLEIGIPILLGGIMLSTLFYRLRGIRL
jgi:hypothetical protein